MGLFDFFGKELDPSQRRWHYDFAHVTLRVLVARDPQFVLSNLSDPAKRSTFIRGVMAKVAENCSLGESQAASLAKQIKVHTRRIGGANAFVIEMPLPQSAPDCYFIAVIPEKSGALDYVTLERSVLSPTMLCRWSAEGKHSNYGVSPGPKLEAFIAAVEESLVKPKAAQEE